MEHQNKLRQFIEGEQHITTDSEEDYDIGTATEGRQSKISSDIRSAGEINSVSSISTSILDDVEEVKALKEKLFESEQKCKTFEQDVNQISVILRKEKEKNEKLEKKLQFVKDNQEVFMRLKEAYINMKYNEAAGRKMIEIREKGVQTWDGILCRGCLEAEQLRRNIENFRQGYKESFIIPPCDMQRMSNTVKYLKDLIERREQFWTNKMQLEAELQNHIKIVEDENITLRKILQCRPIINEETTFIDEMKGSELSQFKKIIIKFEKRFREMDRLNNQEMQIFVPSFNDREKKIIQHLMDKYYVRCGEKEKSRSMPAETRSPASSRPPSRRHRPKSREVNPDSVVKISGRGGDVTMAMMDCLLESNLYSSDVCK